MDLHAWITQQVDAVEQRALDCTATDWRHTGHGIIVDRDTDGWQHAPDEAVIASTATGATPDADHIAMNDPAAALRRCEADRRILARHHIDPEMARNRLFATACHGCGTYGDCDDPVTENLNDCPELLDVAHAHGITDDILAGLDQPQPPAPKPPTRGRRTLTAALGAHPYTPTPEVPAAFRGPNWKRLEAAMRQAEAGHTHNLGDFTHYLDD